MSIIRIEKNIYSKKMCVERVEYKLWGIPILKYTYKHFTDKEKPSNLEGVPLSVQESL